MKLLSSKKSIAFTDPRQPTYRTLMRPANIRFSHAQQPHINRRSDPPLHPSNNYSPASDNFAQENFSPNDGPSR